MNLPRDGTAYRYTALLLIILLAIYITVVIRKYAKDKIYFHITIIDFITYVKQQITFFCAPTNKIISEYTVPEIKNSGIFEEGGIDKNKYLDERGKKLMKDFFSKLGRSSADDQIANCDYTIEAMNKLLDEYKEELPKKYKAYSTITLITGAMLVIRLL